MNDLTTLAMGRIKGKYPLPRHNALLLSCMDLRLMNELTSFMDRDNLTNRYDHLVTAGSGLGITHGETDPTYQCWSESFFLHLKVALLLHHPEDIYLVEHRACGAYSRLINEDFNDSPAQQRKERTSHREHAKRAAAKILAWCADDPLDDGTTVQLRISTFLMDLRGDVEHLDTF